MVENDSARNWQDGLRDELLPYGAFYALGLSWLTVLGNITAWQGGIGVGLLALTGIFGIPATAGVTLMMLWRSTIFGIDCGRIAPMVAATWSAVMLAMLSFAASYPALMLGQAIGQQQQAALASISGLDAARGVRDCSPLCPW